MVAAAGYEATLAELRGVLSERGRYQQLADILTDQAKKLEERQESERAARLWADVAKVAQTSLDDRTLAIAAYTRVVELAPTSDALDALATLHLDREEPAEAARWLERR